MTEMVVSQALPLSRMIASGSCTLGISKKKTGVRQVQNMAFSDDGIHFEKIEQNPVATGADLPDELIAADFRDPKLFEKMDAITP